MNEFLELLEAKEDLEYLISESINELTVSEFNMLLEASAPENDVFQKLDNVRALNPANTLGIIRNAINSKKDNQEVMDKLTKLKNPSLADVRHYRSKQEEKRRAREINTNLAGGAVLGALVGAAGAKNKVQLAKKVLTSAARGAGLSALYGLPSVGLSVFSRKTVGRNEREKQDKKYLDLANAELEQNRRKSTLKYKVKNALGLED